MTTRTLTQVRRQGGTKVLFSDIAHPSAESSDAYVILQVDLTGLRGADTEITFGIEWDNQGTFETLVEATYLGETTRSADIRVGAPIPSTGETRNGNSRYRGQTLRGFFTPNNTMNIGGEFTVAAA